MIRKSIRAKEDALSDDEITYLTSVCQNIKDLYSVYVPLYAGLRVGEVAHLKYSWIDIRDSTINIPPTQDCWCWDCRHYRKGVWSPKTSAGVRSVLIHPILLPILKRYINSVSTNVSRQAIEIRVSRIVKRTNIPHRVYPHALRATCATLWSNQGMSAPTLQYLMGWELLDSAEHYVQSTKKRALKEAMEIVGQ